MAKNDFNDYDQGPVNEEKMLLSFVLDKSGSMCGMPIERLEKSINRCAEDIMKDEKAADRIDVQVTAFNDTSEVVQDWTPLTQMGHISLSAGGGTSIEPALDYAVESLKSRGHIYSDLGTGLKKPWVILITDGYGGDVKRIAEKIKKRTRENKVKLWVLGVPGYHKDTINELCGVDDNGLPIRFFELSDPNGFNFDGFFKFISASVKAVSTSAPGERVTVSDDCNPDKVDLGIKRPTLDTWLND